jgi:putative ABC transport system substrate-binding protein
LKRRDFIALIGGAAGWSLAAHAQQADRIRLIGILFGGFSESDPEPRRRIAEFARSLQEVGWIDGRNLRIELRIGGGDADRITAYAEELIGMAPDVLAANSGAAVAALTSKTKTIPIVFASVNDPVRHGIVASLAHPGGNITGFANLEPDMIGKWLSLLKEITPDIARVLVVSDHANPSLAELERAVEDLAPTLHLQHRFAAVTNPVDLERAIASFVGDPSGGVIVTGGTVASANRNAIVDLARRYRLPAVYPFAYFAHIGGLLSYGVDGADLWRGAAGYVDRILKGEKAADLPVQLPTKYELVINLKTARALGLTMPPTLLATADEVIE